MTAASSRRFDLIAFDWDGTLFDSTQLIVRCIQEAVRDVGGAVPSPEAAAWVIGMALPQALARAAPDVPPSQYAELANRYRVHYAQHQDDLSLFDGVLPMLAHLKASGHLLAVATGRRPGGRTSARATGQLEGGLAASRPADEPAGRPDPLMLHELMAEFDLPPERVLMVGDTTHDLEMARNAVCASVGVAYGAHDSEGFAPLAPLFVAPTVARLDAWLSEHA